MMRKNIRDRFVDMHRLYHFTNFLAACKIIESKQLRFGKPSQMNDLIESNKIVFQRLIIDLEEEDDNNGLFAEKEMRRYQQISFAQDRHIGDAEYMGFDLHAMWGLYADKGYGACLVFDKEKLRLEDGDYAKEVDYLDQVLPDHAFRNKSKAGIKAEIWRRKDDIFFTKERSGNMNKSFVLFAGQGTSGTITILMFPRLCLL